MKSLKRGFFEWFFDSKNPKNYRHIYPTAWWAPRVLRNIPTLWIGKFFAQIFQIWFGFHQQIQNQISIIGQESIPGFANQLSLLKRRKIKLRKDLMSHIFTSHSIVWYQITNHVELIRFLGGFCRWFGIFGFSFYSPSRLFSNNSWHRDSRSQILIQVSL